MCLSGTFICKLLISVLSLLAFCKSSEKSAKTIRTIRKTQIPFNFSVVLFWSCELVNLLYFYPPSHPYHFTRNHPTRNQPQSQGPLLLIHSSTKRTLGTTFPEASRRSAIHLILVKVSIYVSPAEEGH